MTTNPTPKKVSTVADLKILIARRAQHIVFASDFNAWPQIKSDFYSFKAPNERGIHVCERVFHPGALSLEEHEDLCDLILGGSEVIFELNPQQQPLVRFCERFLATLDVEVEARNVAQSSFAQELVRNGDWSVRDGVGPCALRTPVVIGFSDPKNLARYAADNPAVIWSKFWQLSTDPIDSLLKRVGQIIEEHSRSLKPSSSKRYTPPTIDAWIDRTINELRSGIEDQRKLPTIALGELTYAQLPELTLKGRPEKKQIEDLCSKLGARIREKNLQKEWSVIFRAPASSMYDKAALSFSSIDNVMGDCWGYPFAFDMAFGSGVVKVRYEGEATLNIPAEKVPIVITSAVPEPDVDRSLSLNEAMLFDLGQKCLELDKATRKPPSHFAVLKAALVDGMNTYDMARAYKWPRKTAELRLKNIEAKLLSGTKIKYILVESGIFKNVEAQLDAGRERGAKIHRPTLLDNTTGGDDDDGIQE